MKYTVIAPSIQLTSGVLALTEKQAKVRMHNLKPVKGGYEIVNTVQFKHGEEIGYDGDLSPEQAAALEEKSGKGSKSQGTAPPVQTSAQTGADGTTPPAE
jgi:hypothetical protein